MCLSTHSCIKPGALCVKMRWGLHCCDCALSLAKSSAAVPMAFSSNAKASSAKHSQNLTETQSPPRPVSRRKFAVPMTATRMRGLYSRSLRAGLIFRRIPYHHFYFYAGACPTCAPGSSEEPYGLPSSQQSYRSSEDPFTKACLIETAISPADHAVRC